MLEKCTGQVYESIMGNCVVFWLMLTRPTTAPGGDYVNKNCHIGAYVQALRGERAPVPNSWRRCLPVYCLLLLPTGLPSWQRDWTGPIMLIVLFLVSLFNFLFVPCGGLRWLPVSFLLHVKYTLSYHIVLRQWFSTTCWTPIAFNDEVCARWINFITDNWYFELDPKLIFFGIYGWLVKIYGCFSAKPEMSRKKLAAEISSRWQIYC